MPQYRYEVRHSGWTYSDTSYLALEKWARSKNLWPGIGVFTFTCTPRELVAYLATLEVNYPGATGISLRIDDAGEPLSIK